MRENAVKGTYSADDSLQTIGVVDGEAALGFQSDSGAVGAASLVGDTECRG